MSPPIRRPIVPPQTSETPVSVAPVYDYLQRGQPITPAPMPVIYGNNQGAVSQPSQYESALAAEQQSRPPTYAELAGQAQSVMPFAGRPTPDIPAAQPGVGQPAVPSAQPQASPPVRYPDSVTAATTAEKLLMTPVGEAASYLKQGFLGQPDEAGRDIMSYEGKDLLAYAAGKVAGIGSTYLAGSAVESWVERGIATKTAVASSAKVADDIAKFADTGVRMSTDAGRAGLVSNLPEATGATKNALLQGMAESIAEEIVKSPGYVVSNTKTAALGIRSTFESLGRFPLWAKGLVGSATVVWGISSQSRQVQTAQTAVSNEATKFCEDVDKNIKLLSDAGLYDQVAIVKAMCEEAKAAADSVGWYDIFGFQKNTASEGINRLRSDLSNTIQLAEKVLSEHEALLNLQAKQADEARLQDPNNAQGNNWQGSGLSYGQYIAKEEKGEKKTEKTEAKEADQDPDNYYGHNYRGTGLTGADYSRVEQELYNREQDRLRIEREQAAMGMAIESVPGSTLGFGLLQTGSAEQLVDRDKAAQVMYQKPFEGLSEEEKRRLMLLKGQQPESGG